jgi:type VII secretion effector (TIGR04197 family)
MNQSVAEVIEKASQNIQNVGESFEQTDQSISNDIAKN